MGAGGRAWILPTKSSALLTPEAGQTDKSEPDASLSRRRMVLPEAIAAAGRFCTLAREAGENRLGEQPLTFFLCSQLYGQFLDSSVQPVQ
jgi:hypothetical protein